MLDRSYLYYLADRPEVPLTDLVAQAEDFARRWPQDDPQPPTVPTPPPRWQVALGWLAWQLGRVEDPLAAAVLGGWIWLCLLAGITAVVVVR